MRGLTQGEQARLEEVSKKYEPLVKKAGIKNIIDFPLTKGSFFADENVDDAPGTESVKKPKT